MSRSTPRPAEPFRFRRFRVFAARDLCLCAVAGALWVFAPHGTAWQIGTGVLTGLCALLFHEWGHLYGAARSNALVRPSPTVFSPFLFDLDSVGNDRQQFLCTSVWGFYATAVFIVVFATVLPFDVLSGRVAMGIALLLAMLTVVIELPIAWRVYRGHGIPRVEIYQRPDV